MTLRIFILTSDVTLWALQGCLWLLDKYWPAHPPVLIGGYTPPAFALPGYATFMSLGAFKDYPAGKWADGLHKFLQSQTDDIICWTMDDFWLVRPVDDAGVRLLYDHMLVSPHLARVDLTTDRAFAGNMQAAGTLGHLHLVSTPPATPYQLSFQTGLWRREALRQYLVLGESAAETELRGSLRMTKAAANVLGTLEAPVRYKIVVQHGRVCIDEPGYQVPGVEIPAEDRAELARLGYLEPRQAVPV